ncbi:MAG: hypothetical protein Q9191_007958 [Dirinaria sp. TL-2023a]
MTTKACIKNIKALTDIGEAPYNSSIRTLLLAIEQPDQLREIEENCPQIIGHDAEVWIKFIRRDVPEYADEDPPIPTEPHKWHIFYRRLLKRNRKQFKADALQLHKTLSGARQAQVDRQLQKIDFDELPQLPRPDGYTPHPRKPVPPKITKTDTLRFGGGSRTKIRTPADLITKARRTAREAAIFRPGGSNLSRPTKLLTKYARITTDDKPEDRAQPPARTAPAFPMAPTDSEASGPAFPGSYLTEEEKERKQRIAAQRLAEQYQSTSLALAMKTNSSSAPKPAVTSPDAAEPLPSSTGAPPRPLVIKKRPAENPLMPAKRRRAG